MPRAFVGLLLVCVAALAGLNIWQYQRRQLSDRELVDQFTILWGQQRNTWLQNKWFGIQTWQNPNDVWVTQEIIWEIKPDFIVETGTFKGGSAALWALLLEEVNPDGRVITVDIKHQSSAARSLDVVLRRVDFMVGSSTDPEIVGDIAERVKGKRVVVILDSNHSRDHVYKELHAYSPMVPIGSYIIVQDSAVNGHPVTPDFGPGPYEAIEDFLAETDSFVSDRSRERLLLTANPKGFLRRVR